MSHSIRIHLVNLTTEEFHFLDGILKKFLETDQRVRRMIIRGEVSILAREDGRPMFIPTFIPKNQTIHHHD